MRSARCVDSFPSEHLHRVTKQLPGIDGEGEDILQRRKLYERQGRLDEYKQIVERLKSERREHTAKWEGLDPEIAEAVSWAGNQTGFTGLR